MSFDKMTRCAPLLALVVFLTLDTNVSALAQEAIGTAIDRWRPKDGVYAEPGKNFQSSCDERNNMTINLRGKSVYGYEWGCKVKTITDLSPGSVQLDMICNDYNLAQNLNPRDPNWENRQFKEIMFVKRLDEATISVQKSLNGRFKDPPWREAYCPLKTQRALAEATLAAKSEAKQKAKQERALKAAHPRDGVYAVAGFDFDERCTKFNDTVVTFSGKSIATASNICQIRNTQVQLPDTVRIDADCTLQSAPGPDAVRVQDPDTIQDRKNLMFKKIDDKTVILWIIKDGHFTGDGRKLSYCSDQVQRAYAGPRRTSKQTRN
ncbi:MULTISPECIES: hypothetical protein [unclassified Bradyrhizobium]|uniref:hypothetical protein n=1 Tax=unclassified Bradyrhizobium TaxID=2631580 RepID=UPI00211E06F1|nr:MULTISPECIES: hypothetical protein [unclassified Bradyrhizobium]